MFDAKHLFKSERVATSWSVSSWARARIWTLWSRPSATKSALGASGHGPYFGVLVLRDYRDP